VSAGVRRIATDIVVRESTRSFENSY